MSARRISSRLFLFCLLLIAPDACADAQLSVQPIPQAFGVNIHYADKYPVETTTFIKAAGFGWIRQDIYWDKVEKVKGTYDFSSYDALMKAAEDAGLHVLFILDYANPNYDKGLSPASTEARAAFARFAAAAAVHFLGKPVAWEIWNEPNLDVFWKPRPDVEQYIAMADSVTAAIRAATPDAIVIGPAINGPLARDKGWQATKVYLEQVLTSKAAHAWNAITVHPYRSATDTPETAAAQLEEVRAMMRAAGIDPANTPLIASEWGYSTWLRGVADPVQAAYAARTLLLGTIQKMPFSIWYDWQDDGLTPLDRENRFGLIHSGTLEDRTEEEIAKPAFRAVEALSTLLSGYTFDSLIEGNHLVIVARFSKDGQSAYASWSVDDGPRTVSIDLSDGQWYATVINGASSLIKGDSAHSTSITVGIMPTIIYQ